MSNPTQQQPTGPILTAQAEALYRDLSKHHPTRGVSVSMGVTCQCGYWTGEEEPGKTRPVGVRGDQLDWHRTQVAIEFFSTAEAQPRG
jgi:hypothetical protein